MSKISITNLSQYPSAQSKNIFELVSEEFSKKEPMAKEMNVKKEDLLSALLIDSQRFFQLSSVAFNPTTMEILGVFLCSDPSYQSQPQQNSAETQDSLTNFKPSSQILPIFKLLDKCSAIFYEKKGIQILKLQPNDLLQQEMIAVRSNESGKKIGLHLFAHSLQQAKLQGYKSAKVECTSKKSSSLAEKLGYDLIGKVFYKDAIVDDTDIRFFKNIPENQKEEAVNIYCRSISSFDFSLVQNVEQFTYSFI